MNTIYDLIGIGFGPAGIALGAVMADEDEMQGKRQMERLFLEKEPDSSWQSEMLIPNTDIQHHYLRDFATPRNPRSRFTFANYLYEKGRLFSFGHLGKNPGRLEWNDYILWVADQLSEDVRYQNQVLGVHPILEDGRVDLFQVKVRDLTSNTETNYLSRNVSINVGRIPHVPNIYQSLLGDNVFHSSKFLSKIKRLDGTNTQSFAVVGSGQNAIEIILYLADRYPDATIYSINRGPAFRIVDLGHFSNEVFFPEFTDYFYSLTEENKEKLFNSIRLTNYSVVDVDVSQALYWRIYEENIMNKQRIHVTKFQQVVAIEEHSKHYKLYLEDLYNKERSEISVQNIILCTGFKEEKVPKVLQPLQHLLMQNEDGTLQITRDYQILTDKIVRGRLYINGLTERTHGISDSTSFSMMALKAERIYKQIKEELNCQTVFQK
ncbi:SidA/IucD/PvdA family monooxygenase [Thermoactinomyces sp. CICC 10521]|uniref:SidA/IucD/PvdA family monooxygenase n=1 Tax=Thermoactinomyces sp. CICC 10521 TaxID=2767426 RepID=UPI0018DC16CE|nr:SidA/IucD/PvdA family monooxygenase [Thermoactinomyces sp. CICC 10521]MBH8608762.1 SidA/IucD/PvdA family monooxygenase [Thermoactinomyces sp. CICC 10521]